MKKFLFLIILTLELFGFNSNQIDTTIITTSKFHAIINKKVQKGLTGYVIHNDMMIAKAVSVGNGSAKYLPLTKLKNTALATPNIMPQKGDKIIFGLYNFRGLIIAPNQATYLKTKQKYPNITFINSDIFAPYFDTKPKTKDFHKFCRDFNVGIVDFVLDKEYIVDCESFYVLEEKNTTSQKYTKPLYTNYQKLKTSLFESIPNNWINYYKSLLKVANGQ